MTFKYEQESLTFEVIRYATEEVKKCEIYEMQIHVKRIKIDPMHQ